MSQCILSYFNIKVQMKDFIGCCILQIVSYEILGFDYMPLVLLKPVCNIQ